MEDIVTPPTRTLMNSADTENKVYSQDELAELLLSLFKAEKDESLISLAQKLLPKNRVDFAGKGKDGLMYYTVGPYKVFRKD